jgi:hypothetical protein
MLNFLVNSARREWSLRVMFVTDHEHQEGNDMFFFSTRGPNVEFKTQNNFMKTTDLTRAPSNPTTRQNLQ